MGIEAGVILAEAVALSAVALLVAYGSLRLWASGVRIHDEKGREPPQGRPQSVESPQADSPHADSCRGSRNRSGLSSWLGRCSRAVVSKPSRLSAQQLHRQRPNDSTGLTYSKEFTAINEFVTFVVILILGLSAVVLFLQVVGAGLLITVPLVLGGLLAGARHLLAIYGILPEEQLASEGSGTKSRRRD